MVNRLRPRTLWMWWAALSGGAVVMALVNPPWLAMGLVVIALVGLQLLDTGRVPNRVRQQHWEAIWRWPEDHPFRVMARRASGLVVMFAAAFAGLAWQLPGHPRLQALALVAALAGLTDSTATFRRVQVQLAEQERIRLAPMPREPDAGGPGTYAELWEEEPDLPAAEADQWEAFLDRATDASHDDHDDLTQIDGWYEAPRRPGRIGPPDQGRRRVTFPLPSRSSMVPLAPERRILTLPWPSYSSIWPE